MSGTPEKILEHLLEMMRLDSEFRESGSAQRPSPRPACERVKELLLFSSVLSGSVFLPSVLFLLLRVDLFVLIYN